jgi:hypothetical protein
MENYSETFEKRPLLPDPGAYPVGIADRTGVVKIFAILGLEQN